MIDLPKLGAVTRRRFLTISAAMAGTAAVSLCHAKAQTGPGSGAAFETFTWHGVALGAQASLTLQHRDEGKAKAAIVACVAECARLEAIFSLHRPDSAISQLNANGVLREAPADLRRVLGEAVLLAGQSHGYFDPTIQPLWDCYTSHFERATNDRSGPPPHKVAEARALVDWRAVNVSQSTVRFAKPNMAVTLNGIAQGYITDRVADLLRNEGFEHVLVNMGELAALGPKFDGASWHVQIPDPLKGDTLATLAMAGGAVATSSFTGFSFDESGEFGHIFDPRSGLPAKVATSVTVVSETAARADGLSTAIAAGAEPRPLLGQDRALIQYARGAPPIWITGEA